MKKTATFLIICTMMASVAFAQTKKKTKAAVAPVKTEKKAPQTQVTFGPSITWENTSWDFGSVTQHQPATKEFIFSNTGTVPIVIESVDPSCSCTAGDYTKEPVMPGKKGYIKLTFNAAMPGQFSKSATVKTSASETRDVLLMKGTVIVIKTEPAPAPKQ